MRRLTITVIVGIAFLFIAGIVVGAATITKKAGEYTVDVTMEKSPPTTGKNKLDIVVKDQTGKTVTDAKVTVEYSMPAMPGMPPMNYKATAALSGEHYIATIEPSMASSWNVAVKVARGGKTDTAKLTIDVK